MRAFTAKIDTDKLTDRNIKFRDDYQKFVVAKDEEIENAFDTGTFKRVEKYDVPAGTKIYNMMWVHKIKPATKLEPERYRSRLCVLGNRQDANSYSQTFAAVAKVKMFRLLLSVSVFFGLRMTQIDISNAFMYANLDREIYVHPPPGYEHLGVLKLEKSLYGLKQAPRLWYDTMANLLTKKVSEGGLGFRQLKSDVCCFTHPTKRCYVLMYVDDICIFTKDEELRQEILSCLKENFKLRSFDTSGVYLGLELDWSENGDRVKVHQTSYIEKLLQVFRMEDSDAVNAPALSKVRLSRTDPVSESAANRPYRSLIGGLLYTLGSRPDAASAIRTCSQYMAEGADLHWQAGKRILRYLKGTKEKGVVYTKQDEYRLQAYCDSDWAQDPDDRKSVTGYVIYAQGGPVAWKSKKQATVARSSAEAEYVALADTISELLWIKMALSELEVPITGEIEIHIDNAAAQSMAENPVNHERTKHIDTAFHFIREVVKAKVVSLYHVNTKENIADLFTKAVSWVDFKKHVGSLVTS